MRKFLLLVVVMSCSQPAQPAHSQPPDAQAVVLPPREPAASRPAEIAKPAPADHYAGIMGVQLQPVEMIERTLPQEAVQVMQKALATMKIECDQTEFIGLRSQPYYRLVDAEATAFLDDARKIGWRFQPAKTWDDVTVYIARWHGQIRAVVFNAQPERLSIGICHPKPTAATAAKPAR